jgi:uncharacterized protein (DUF433 family)
MAPAPHSDGPYVERRPGICGGVPVIRGTRFPVRSVVEYVLRQGMAPEELVAMWKHITLAKVHAALAFYYDHKREIDADMRRNRQAFARSNQAS